MKQLTFVSALALALATPAFAAAQAAEANKGVAGKRAFAPLEKQINKTLLEESRKNQCSFKPGSDELEAGCDAKAKRLGTALINARKKINNAGVRNFKFLIIGHTDTVGPAEANKVLSEKRAAMIKSRLVAQGIPAGEILVVGAGASLPLVVPDDTPDKQARNRRYEIQVRL